jgi:hypothetical protein
MRLLYLLTALLLPIYVQCQEIAENRIDDFLNTHIVKTDWVQINHPSEHLAFFRVSAIDSAYSIEYKKVVPKAYVVDRQPLLVKFKGSEEMMQLESSEKSQSCNGCGARGFAGSDAWGIHLVYRLSNNAVQRLRHEQISKIRIYTEQGYIEEDFTTEKQVKKALYFQKAFMLVMAEVEKK